MGCQSNDCLSTRLILTLKPLEFRYRCSCLWILSSFGTEIRLEVVVAFK